MDDQTRRTLLKVLIDEYIGDRYRYTNLLTEESLTEEGKQYKKDLKQVLDLLKKLNIIDFY
jgi:hypothetical protein